MEITKKQIFSFVFLLLTVFSMSFLARPVRADDKLLVGQEGIKEIGAVYGGDKVQKDPRALITDLVLIVLTFLAVIFLVLTVFAGFKYMTSAGNSDKTVEALKMLRNAVIGLFIVLASWMIVRYVIVMSNRAVSNASDVTTYPTRGM
jgi:heme/copper-type cytochrome/quinol oxidase subunit 2